MLFLNESIQIIIWFFFKKWYNYKVFIVFSKAKLSLNSRGKKELSGEWLF